MFESNSPSFALHVKLSAPTIARIGRVGARARGAVVEVAVCRRGDDRVGQGARCRTRRGRQACRTGVRLATRPPGRRIRAVFAATVIEKVAVFESEVAVVRLPGELSSPYSPDRVCRCRCRDCNRRGAVCGRRDDRVREWVPVVIVGIEIDEERRVLVGQAARRRRPAWQRGRTPARGQQGARPRRRPRADFAPEPRYGGRCVRCVPVVATRIETWRRGAAT